MNAASGDTPPNRSLPEPVTAVTDAAGVWLPARMTEVEQGLLAAVRGDGELADDAVRTLKAGGKRMRPMLVLLCAGPLAGAKAVRAGIAVELIHMASLVHDDVLDRAPLRRGLPTVFASSGRDRATALGDRLFSTAFRILVDGGDHEAVSEVSATAVDLARGELRQRQGAFNLDLTEADYFERCGLKTGRLFEAACVLGRSSTGGDPEPIGLFGQRIGLAFQLLDDVLDVAGPPDRTGKARGTDLLDGTVTLPLIIAARVDRSLLEVDLASLDEASAERVCDRIAATGALEQVRGQAIGLIDEAKAGLTGAGVEPDQKQLLELIADGVVLRYS
ncbi:MAG: polyprenyl synthetase family protein [Solirubrobacterales bacterium]|nr:polyprenyl synthetase family protein [Solirubrobacterales bacterium]